MEYLLTWVEGEEVQYKFMDRADLQGLKVEPDRIYSIIELSTGEIVKDIEGLRRNQVA